MLLKVNEASYSGVILSLFGTRAGVIAALMAAQLLSHLRKKVISQKKAKKLMEKSEKRAKRAKKTRKDQRRPDFGAAP